MCSISFLSGAFVDRILRCTVAYSRYGLGFLESLSGIGWSVYLHKQHSLYY